MTNNGFSTEAMHSLNPKNQEILRLKEMLDTAGIPHVIRRVYDGWQILYPDAEGYACSVIEHMFSCGCEMDRLEIFRQDDNTGYMTADDVFQMIKMDWKRRSENG